MKILYDYNAFSIQEYGGISRYYTELNNVLFNKPGIDNKIIAPIHKNIHLKKNKSNLKLNVYLKTYPKYSSSIIKKYNFYTSNLLINIIKPDVLHQTYYSNETYKLNTKTKLVITVYDLIHEIFYKDFGLKEDYRPKTNSLLNADLIICISNNTKKDLMRFYNIQESKIRVIHLGCTNFDLNRAIDRKLVTNDPYILFVGSRKRYKNFHNLLLAYSKSSKLSQDLKIICFGGGKFNTAELNFFNDLKIKEDSLIQLNGDDKFLSMLYKKAEAFIFPSLYEGFGLPTLESMKNKCPAILSNHDTLREVAGDAGIYFDPLDPDSICQRIEEVVYSDSLKQKLIDRGIEHVKKFTWEKCADKTEEIYNELT